MITISIVPVSASPNETMWQAVAGEKKSLGKTAGEALDALTRLLGAEHTVRQFIVQSLQPDQFFTAQQQQRLAELMTQWREARDQQTPFPPEDQAELQALIDAELEGSAQRVEALHQDQRP